MPNEQESSHSLQNLLNNQHDDDRHTMATDAAQAEELSDDFFPLFSQAHREEGGGGTAVKMESLNEDENLSDEHTHASFADEISGDSQSMHKESESCQEDCLPSATGLPSAVKWWPHPSPPPRVSPPQTTIGLHTQRYGRFIRAYMGLTDREVALAQRRARTICVIGVHRMKTSDGRKAHGAIRAARSFLRHSVVSVEGDAVFAELVDRAATLYAADIHRLAECRSAAVNGEGGSDGPVLPPFLNENPVGSPASRKPQQRKSNPGMNEYQPNARCIALRYSCPSSTAASAEADQSATLLAVVCSTRIEEGEHIRVSLESYYRCLDEAEWYRQRYIRSAELSPYASNVENVLHGDLCHGVKHFQSWPAGLKYYHGVGARHAGDEPLAGFPFTLLNLSPAPHLGEGEKGLTAAAFIPYATCFLYTGPSIATKRVERLIMLGGTTTTDAEKSEKNKAVPPHGHEPETDAAEEMEEEEDLSFARDDTYALGLGRHGVCFGQGLARYVNHRYNTSRFGNVELCSVMLSVPSEFSVLNSHMRSAKHPKKKPQRQVQARKSSSGKLKKHALRKDSGIPIDHTSETVKRIAKKAVNEDEADTKFSSRSDDLMVGQRPPRAAAVAALEAFRLHTNGYSAESSDDTKKKKYRPRSSRCIFLEEQSHFVTVPFFISTTDVEAGAALLAWTYGEEYDSKLERVAVADGALVPYADAELLNARPIMGMPATPPGARQWQRYGGDYRFAVSVGDIVWRRRPATAQQHNKRLRRLVCPSPEDDLFVVLQCVLSGTSHVLLRPLTRIVLSDDELEKILTEQQLASYVSPAAPAGLHSLGDEDEVAIILGARLYSRSPSAVKARRSISAARPLPQNSRPVVGPRRAAAAWAVFDTPTDSHSHPTGDLQKCVVATTSSVALLLPDVDYSIAHPLPGSPSRSSRSHFHRIIVNLDDLRHSSQLVRGSERACAVPPLLTGLLWSALRTQPPIHAK